MGFLPNSVTKMRLSPIYILEAELLSADRQNKKTSNFKDLLLACTLIPVKLTLTPSGVTWEAKHFQEQLAAMCSTYQAELEGFLRRLPDGQWDSMKLTPDGKPPKKR